jgi:hypothetical protein
LSIPICITESFHTDAALRLCAVNHSMEFECPLAIAFGAEAQCRSLPQLFYAWFNTDTHRLPLQSIIVGAPRDSPPARVTQALKAVSQCFSLGNAQNWRVMCAPDAIHFFAGSDLSVKYLNVGFAMATFEAAAAQFGVKGGWAVLSDITCDDLEYLASWTTV